MNSNSELQSLRHSAEHILTQAMEHLYPKKFLMAMGPATDDGFYFDFEPLKDFKISEADFPQIEAEMTKIVKQNLPIVKKEIPLDEAKKIFKHNPYKMEWLNSIKDRGEVITVYQTGDDFIDLCAGPHVRYTSKVKAFKLLSIAGAYWHGDEKNKMLTRIYGTAFESKEDLQKYIDLMVEIQKRDHRKLGKDLGLFTFSDLIGSGLPLYTPKGAFIRLALNNYVESVQTKQGYT